MPQPSLHERSSCNPATKVTRGESCLPSDAFPSLICANLHSMRHEFTAEQVSTYRTTGFLVVEGFLDQDELADWRAQVDEAVAQRVSVPRSEQKLTNISDDPDNFYAQVFLQCIKLADTHA